MILSFIAGVCVGCMVMWAIEPGEFLDVEDRLKD